METQVKTKEPQKVKLTGNQVIAPHLWFDKEAKEAAEFYVSVFGEDSAIKSSVLINDTPSGDAEMVTFRLRGHDFLAISAGPYFKFNPSISFLLNFDPSQNRNARKDLDEIWGKLSQKGKILMPLDEYPYSKRYGWVEDKYGLSWQLFLSDPEGEQRPFITYSLLFVGDVFGKAEEAMNYYCSVFSNSKVGMIARNESGTNLNGTIMYEDFMLEGTWFAAMETAGEQGYSFNEAVSFVVSCDTQEQIDYFWKKLSAHPESEQCGWCKDKYGLSWQIVPSRLGEFMNSTAEQRKRVTQAFLQMKKFDIAALEQAYYGK